MSLPLKGALALAGLAALGLVGPLHAAPNLVNDGDFETALASPATPLPQTPFTAGSPFDANWVITGGVGIDSINDSHNQVYVYDGTQSLFLNDAGPGSTSSVSQNLQTVANQQYTLSFAAGANFTTNELDVTFGNTIFAPIVVPNNVVDPINNPLGFSGPPPGNDSTFTLYSFDVTATGPFTGLTFSSPTPIGDPGGATLELDDIVVTPAPVPEASTTVSFGLLMALGLGGFALKAHRRVKA